MATWIRSRTRKLPAVWSSYSHVAGEHIAPYAWYNADTGDSIALIAIGWDQVTGMRVTHLLGRDLVNVTEVFLDPGSIDVGDDEDPDDFLWRFDTAAAEIDVQLGVERRVMLR